MSSAFVYSILAVLPITVHFTMAFYSDIHEKMTRSERLAVFGSEDSVPEYKVFPISLPGARRRRETNAAIELKVVLRDREITLTLSPTDGYLVSKYTPVWSAERNIHTHQNIDYVKLTSIMSEIGEFRMYHDVENGAAVTIYVDRTEGIIIEGIVTPHYAIRSLPKRLIGETLSEGHGLIWHKEANKRSIRSDAKEDTVYVVVFKIQDAPHHVKPSALVGLGNRLGEIGAGDTYEERKVPKAVYPEILVVVDHNAIRNETIIGALRFVLAFWNGVDLIYREFEHPKVRLNIAGIIIARDKWATRYIPSNVSVSYADGIVENMVSIMGKYYYNERFTFPTNGYDMIIAMTTVTIHMEFPFVDEEQFTYRWLMFGVDRNTTCLSTSEIRRMKTTRRNGIIGYTWEFDGIFSAARAVAQIFGAENDEGQMFSGCSWGEGHVMEEFELLQTRKFKWSKCSRLFFSQYFSSEKSKCLDNEPRWRNAVRETLPGRWVPIDDQCRNEGYSIACKLRRIPMCVATGCQAKGSGKCIRTGRVPLPGTKCAPNKHCSIEKQCVYD